MPIQGRGPEHAGHVAVHMVVFDLDGGFVLAIDGMKMWHAMVVVEHGDYDAKKARDLRHSSLVSLSNGFAVQSRAARESICSSAMNQARDEVESHSLILSENPWADKSTARANLRANSINASEASFLRPLSFSEC